MKTSRMKIFQVNISGGIMNEDKCYITTVKDFPKVSGLERIEYIKEIKAYGFGYGAKGLTNLEVGSRICFYVPSKESVVLHAIIASGIVDGNPPKEWEINGQQIYYDVEYKLDNVMDINPPVKLIEVREKLGLSKRWGNFVISTHEVDPTDFNILIGGV